MRLVILLFAFAVSTEPFTLTGVVLIDDYPISSCSVQILENGASQMTDANGKFQLKFSDLNNVTLKIKCLNRLTCEVEISDITTGKSNIDVGTIPLFFNQTISVADYKKLGTKEKRTFEEIRHWNKLIGYISRNRVDTSAVRVSLRDKRKIRFRIDSIDSKVIVNYKDWIR